MNLLFLTNFYPPASRGGYEQWCQEVAEELARRGHQVQVLTARVAGQPEIQTENGVTVLRQLSLEVEGGLLETIQRMGKERKNLEAANLAQVIQLVANFKPDVALMWGMWNVPRSVPALVEKLLPGRAAYYFCDYWPSLPNAYIQRWRENSKQSLAQLPKRLLGNHFLKQLEAEAPIKLKFEHPICVSRAVRDILVKANVALKHAQIIYGGTQVEEFVVAGKNRPPRSTDKLKLVYIGRLVADKGVHTIIQALSLIPASAPAITLDIFGQGDAAYINHLTELTKKYGLSAAVTLRGNVPRAEIPTVLARFDALIFSSEWAEPFARSVLEAMASGLVVIGTTTGGTGEILQNGKTGLTYPAADAQALANQIQTLADSPALQQQLAAAGQQCVSDEFTFTRMVNNIETALNSIDTNSSATQKSPSFQGVLS